MGSEMCIRDSPYSWNSKANLLYIDQPAGTGFSYGSGQDHNEKQVAAYVAFAVLLRANAAAPAPDERGYSSPVCPTLRPDRFKRADPTPCRTIPYFHPKARDCTCRPVHTSTTPPGMPSWSAPLPAHSGRTR